MIRSLVLAMLLCQVGSFVWGQTPLPGTQVAQTYRNPQHPEQTLNYLLSLPPGYGTEKKAWPVLVFLHGSGERGNDLTVVRKHGPPKLVEQSSLPFIVLSPQCPKEVRWYEEPVFSALQGMLTDFQSRYSIDPARIYLTGLSMGGQGTWYWAHREPYRFAAILPICGKADVAWAESIPHLPIWIFHGAKDTAVLLSESEKMVTAINALGGDPRLSVYPEAAHDSWTETYANPQIYEWLLTHTKQTEPEKPLVAPKP